VTALLAATLYQGNPDRNHILWSIDQLRDIYSICRFCLATFGFLKGENIIVYERDIDEDVNMLFHLK
jgi:hypothetical protein